MRNIVQRKNYKRYTNSRMVTLSNNYQFLLGTSVSTQMRTFIHASQLGFKPVVFKIKVASS